MHQMSKVTTSGGSVYSPCSFDASDTGHGQLLMRSTSGASVLHFARYPPIFFCIYARRGTTLLMGMGSDGRELARANAHAIYIWSVSVLPLRDIHLSSLVSMLAEEPLCTWERALMVENRHERMLMRSTSGASVYSLCEISTCLLWYLCSQR